MSITLENNELVYIYLMKRNNHERVVDSTIACAPCRMLFDSKGIWVGIEIGYYEEELYTESNEVSELEITDELEPKLIVIQEPDCLRILFRENADVIEVKNQDCNIDIKDGAISGIEILLWLSNRLTEEVIPSEQICRVLKRA